MDVPDSMRREMLQLSLSAMDKIEAEEEINRPVTDYELQEARNAEDKKRKRDQEDEDAPEK